MKLRYTGVARTLTLGDKVYAQPDVYRKNPDAFSGSLGDPINISQELAIRLSESSNLHSFEIVGSGEDLLDKVTDPDTGVMGTDADVPMLADEPKKAGSK